MAGSWELNVAPRTPELAHEIARRIAKAAAESSTAPLSFHLVVASRAAAEAIKEAIEDGPPHVVRPAQVQIRAIAGENERPPDGRSRETAAMEWLRDYFEQWPPEEPVPVSEVVHHGSDAGFSAHQLQRAKRRLGVRSIRGQGREWLWTTSRESRDDVLLWASDPTAVFSDEEPGFVK